MGCKRTLYSLNFSATKDYAMFFEKFIVSGRERKERLKYRKLKLIMSGLRRHEI